MARSHHTREHGAMPIHVVGSVIVRDGRVLAARRSRPAALEGGWEFPGGKVEPHESERDALAREIAEELGVQIAVGERLGEASDGGIRLVLLAAELVAGQPVAGGDHDELRWLATDQLDSVSWLPIDRDLLHLVRNALREWGTER
jgi:8-oxo-dGTP diphosphatase